MRPAGVLAGVFLLLPLYYGVDPFKHSAIYGIKDFKAYKVDVPAWSEIPVEKDTKNLLQRSKIKFLNQIQGPESIAFDSKGHGPYTGIADGTIVLWDGVKWVDFAYTYSNRSGLCDPNPSPVSYLKNEHICDRPLGLQFDKRTGDLYITDAYFGLMKVGPEGGLAETLTTEAEGVLLGFTNDLDNDDEGNIYFTDSRTKYQRRNFMLLVYSAEDSGRVLKYGPSPNGLPFFFSTFIRFYTDNFSLEYAALDAAFLIYIFRHVRGFGHSGEFFRKNCIFHNGI